MSGGGEEPRFRMEHIGSFSALYLIRTDRASECRDRCERVCRDGALGVPGSSNT